MSMRNLLLVLVAFGLVAACSGPSSSPAAQPAPPPVVAETPPATKDPGSPIDQPSTQPSIPPPEQKKADGASCLVADECQSGICEGEGCTDDKPGKCAPKSRACTRDLRAYCGCDGKTFQTSGSCPNARFSARAACSK